LDPSRDRVEQLEFEIEISIRRSSSIIEPALKIECSGLSERLNRELEQQDDRADRNKKKTVYIITSHIPFLISFMATAA
jgi:hypothetical protein